MLTAWSLRTRGLRRGSAGSGGIALSLDGDSPAPCSLLLAPAGRRPVASDLHEGDPAGRIFGEQAFLSVTHDFSKKPFFTLTS